MAETKTVNLEVNSNLSQTEQAVTSLKSELRKAQEEVAILSDKFGATSREAVDAAKRAAELKDRIGDAKSLTEAFNPDAKFKALTGALTGVAGGFSVVTGLMGTLGAESKEVEGAILKVQSAMAIASGAQAVGESIDSFKQLGAVVKSFSLVQKISTAAQWLWNAAMAANPIGAIVAVVVALIAAGYALVKMFIASSDATKKAEAANKALNKELDNQVKSQKAASQEAELARDLQLGMAKASGKSAAEIRKLSVELANQEVKQKLVNAQTLYAIALEAQRVAGLEDATDAEKETAKNALKAYNDSNEALKTSILNRKKLLNENKIAEKQEETDARKEQAEATKKANEEAIEKQKKHNEELLEKQKKANQERIDEFLRLKRAETDAANQAALEREKADTAFFDKEMEARKNNELSKMTEQEADIERIRLKYETDLEYARKNNLDASALKEAQENEINEINLKYQGIKYQNEAAAAQKSKQLEQDLLNAKLAFAQQGLSLVAEIAGKGSKIGKAVAVAQATISGIEGVQNAYSTAQKSPITIGFPAYPIVQASLAGVFAALQVRKILSTNVGSSSTSSLGSVSGGGGGAAPSFNVVGNSGVNQLAETMQGRSAQAPIQAYVVANDVTTAQGLNRNIVTNASLG
jgi:hypothetical protein